MTWTPWCLPTASVSDTEMGSRGWDDVTKIRAADDDFAWASSLTNSYPQTTGLAGYTFKDGSDTLADLIPAGSTINRVALQICRFSWAHDYWTDPVEDAVVKLYYSSSAIGNNKAASGNWPEESTEDGPGTVIEYDYTAAQWGGSLDRAKVVDSSFGAILSAIKASGSMSGFPFVDYFKLRVDYTPASPPVLHAYVMG